MKPKTLRARVALWSVTVVSGALILFGAGAAWNLRRELLENLDEEIRTEAAEFAAEIAEQHLDRKDQPGADMFFADEAQRFPYVEVRDAAGATLFRSPALGDHDVFPIASRPKSYNVTLNGRTIRFATFQSGASTFALGKDLNSANETLAELVRAYLLTLPLVLIAVGAGGWWIAHRAVAPIKMIAAQAARISATDLHERIPEPSSRDEIGHLTQVLNEMFDRLQRSFEQVTRFTSDASHELKTPLTLMRAQAESALTAAESTPAQRELLSDLIEQCSQLSQIVDGLLLLSLADNRRLALEQSNINLAALVRELMEDAEMLAEPLGLVIRCELPADLPVVGDARLLRRAVMNLIDNAIKYNFAGGTIALSGSANETRTRLKVRNTGSPIPPEIQSHIFDRFYRSDLSPTKEIAGHGLGLSIAREIARAHDGEVALVHSDSAGTEFEIVIQTGFFGDRG